MVMHMVTEKKQGRFTAVCGITFAATSATDLPTGFASRVTCRACVLGMANRTNGVRNALVGTPAPARRVES